MAHYLSRSTSNPKSSSIILGGINHTWSSIILSINHEWDTPLVETLNIWQIITTGGMIRYVQMVKKRKKQPFTTNYAQLLSYDNNVDISVLLLKSLEASAPRLRRCENAKIACYSKSMWENIRVAIDSDATKPWSLKYGPCND